MKRRERYIASLDEVTITRDGDYVWIAYKEEGIGATRLQIGPEIAEMSDREILELHNECLRAQAKRAAEYKHVAVEVPLGWQNPGSRQSPQALKWRFENPVH